MVFRPSGDFTFHSGYILMRKTRVYLNAYDAVFTFHSGYILINFEEEMPEKAMTLHSILVIF